MSASTADIPTLTARLEKLESENRHLLARLAKLEKRGRAGISGFFVTVMALLSGGLFLSYLGLYPRHFERLPLKADTVETEKLILVGNHREPRLILTVEPGKGATFSQPEGTRQPVFPTKETK